MRTRSTPSTVMPSKPSGSRSKSMMRTRVAMGYMLRSASGWRGSSMQSANSRSRDSAIMRWYLGSKMRSGMMPPGSR